MEKRFLEEIKRINNLMGYTPSNKDLFEESNSLIVNTNTSNLILEQGYSLDVIKRWQIENLKAIIAGKPAPRGVENFLGSDGKTYPSYYNTPRNYAQNILTSLEPMQPQIPRIGVNQQPQQTIFDYSTAKYEEANKKPGFLVDPCGWVDTSLNPQAKSELNLGTQYRNEVGYRQQDGMRASVYNESQPIMECWDCQIFDGNSNAANCMFIPGKQIMYDDFGYFVFVDDQNQVRLYLPKNEFFTSMANKIKSIVAYKTCSDACSAKEKGIAPKTEEIYTIIYTLKYPEKAILSQTMGPNGLVVEDSGDITRGWEISSGGVKETGYFNFKDAYKGGESDQLGAGEELSLENYAEKYAKSDFDIWYDGKWGTMVSIGVAVFAGWAAGAYLAPAMLGWVEAQGARTLGKMIIELAVEYVIAAPEIVYLNERGMTAQMVFIGLLAHIPVIQYKWIDPKFGLDPDIVYGQSTELFNRYRSGQFKTPGDLKTWLKNLDPEVRVQMEKVLKIVGDELVANPSLFRQSFADQMAQVVKKATKGDLDKVTKAWTKIEKNYQFKIPTASQNLLKTGKIMGIIMVPAFGLNYALTEIISENPIVKDPLKLGEVQKALETLTVRLEESQKKQLASLMMITDNKINQAILNQDYGQLVSGITDRLRMFEDTQNLKNASLNLKTGKIQTRAEIISPFVTTLLGFLLKKIADEQKASYAKGMALISETANILKKTLNITFEQQELALTNFCPGLKQKQTTLKTKQEVCAFKDWVKTYHKDFSHTVKLNGQEFTAYLTSCATWDQNNIKHTDNFYLSECLFLYAWEKYGSEYTKSVLTPLNKKSAPVNPNTQNKLPSVNKPKV